MLGQYSVGHQGMNPDNNSQFKEALKRGPQQNFTVMNEKFKNPSKCGMNSAPRHGNFLGNQGSHGEKEAEGLLKEHILPENQLEEEISTMRSKSTA